MNCTKCNESISIANINIQTDIAHCQKCNHVFKISESFFHSPNLSSFDYNHPPQGAWIIKDMNTLKIGATTRSPIAFFLVPFMMVWSGFSIGGMYGSQIISGKFDLFMSLFGIPFLLGSVVFWSLALMAIFGKVELLMDKKGGVVFTGIGSIGIKKRFVWEDIDTVNESVYSNFKYPGKQGPSIRLEGKRRISFGTGLNESRRYYIHQVLKLVCRNIKVNKILL